MSERFLSRLASDRREPDVTRSIAEHLQVLLNTREGGSATTPDFGLPDLTDVVHTTADGLQAVQNIIRDIIEKYEPRLSKVKVRFMPSDDPFVLYFDIAGRRTEDGSSFRVRTAMLPGHRFEVNR